MEAASGVAFGRWSKEIQMRLRDRRKRMAAGRKDWIVGFQLLSSGGAADFDAAAHWMHPSTGPEVLRDPGRAEDTCPMQLMKVTSCRNPE